MAGNAAYPIDHVGVINPFNIHENFPKVLAGGSLVASVVCFLFSEFFHYHLDDGARIMFDFFLGALSLIGVPSVIIACRIRWVEIMPIWVFAIIKAVFTTFYFFFFRWLGNLLLPHSDGYIAASSVCFFAYIYFLRLMYGISDDFGAGQGFLAAGYTVILNKYPHYLQIWWVGGLFAFFVAIVNIPPKPAPAPAPEPEHAVVEHQEEDIEMPALEEHHHIPAASSPNRLNRRRGSEGRNWA